MITICKYHEIFQIALKSNGNLYSR
uniref:Uncharacterized protein n=1 Tax=Arundo donax TaxID=35708 RepID=A0A0A9F406_ARUDO